jgi:hypothetical protein
MQKKRALSSPTSGWILLFGLVFFLVGLLMSWIYFSGYIKYWAAASWEEVPCWIESAKLETKHHESTGYKATATYRYRYRGHLYEGNQVSLGSGFDNIGSFQLRISQELQRYANNPGAKPDAFSRLESQKAFRCFVNPAKPESAVLYRSLRWEMQAFLAIFALTFPAVGAFLIAGGIVGSKDQIRENTLRDRYPEQPWKWNPAWAGEFIPEEGRFGRAGLLTYTIWSGGVVLPLVATIALGGFIHETKAVLVALIFFGLWCIPASFSFKHLRQRLAVGSVHFEQANAPAQSGGQLHGAIVLQNPLCVKGSVEVKLECQKRVTHNGGTEGSTTTVETLWSRSVRLPGTMGAGGPFQCRIPVHFRLPPDAPESAVGDSSNMRHEWKLKLNTSEPNLHASFEIPVFRTGSFPALDADIASDVPSILDTASLDLPALLAHRKIHAAFDQAGFPVSLVCPPARNLGLIGFLTLFNVLWTGIAVFLILRQAPLLFRIVWPCSAVFLWGLVLWNILHKRTATFHASGVSVTNELFPFRWVRSFQKSEISGFSSAVHMTSSTTNFYRIQLTTVLGKKETLVDGITESSTAEALVGRLGLWKQSPDVSSEELRLV